MAGRAHPLFLWIFLLILAPVGAAVVVTLLLLLGVEPRLVFAPGRALKSFLELCGLHPANRVAVAGTVGFLWAIIAAAGLAWERRRGAT
jgi:hypothetical protein